MLSVAGAPPHGKIVKALANLDKVIADVPASRARVEMFYQILADVFPDGLTGRVQSIALGRIARARWGRLPEEPRTSVLTTLARINWDSLLPTNAMKFLPLALAEIERRWPERGWER